MTRFTPFAAPTGATLRRLLPVLPGVTLCFGLAIVAYGGQALEARWLGRAWLEALNLALLTGIAVRTRFLPGPALTPGIACCARLFLNVAIVMMGLSFSVSAVLSLGPALLCGVVGIVLCSLAFTGCLGRWAGLSSSQAVLVACGDSICGNSAIMAAAPVIGAREEEVGSTIAFTAVGGLVVVIGLPLIAPLLPLSDMARGELAGMTVYAVPQVIAAASPFGAAALHVGTLVKLMRVLMLGPVCVALCVLMRRRAVAGQAGVPSSPLLAGARTIRLVPWYIAGFIAMLLLRSVGLVPGMVLEPAGAVASFLTVLAMAALGLGIDPRAVTGAGGRLVLTVAGSLAALLAASLALVHELPVG
ncbi:hypothetical protein AA103196_0039 [Ameyamaea chiangmaiensis NBRC 103196]|uniref:Putative sulfate exporter family transporter n=1 Tax=Ameyamaea chiangmaiensis TaxID=442969 RepID=A0A850P869_9PROT|nr:putative sulfate exporter family transporter [Ameyamaea chiangmaiensis]MBS4076003.1 putative sulfate exporter family transporter [Ameyamaea chiangmaiensis]NVN40815.1 putative sulfate exporter family transporter [Ameyamaea chiangmaiensis]GBQ61488.1 hypothetical protein AA103196_0039 [Ameyamaea chiangmaiensis NBRC 103196]